MGYMTARCRDVECQMIIPFTASYVLKVVVDTSFDIIALLGVNPHTALAILACACCALLMSSAYRYFLCYNGHVRYKSTYSVGHPSLCLLGFAHELRISLLSDVMGDVQVIQLIVKVLLSPRPIVEQGRRRAVEGGGRYILVKSHNVM